MFDNTIKFFIRDTHSPDEIINVLNMFLMSFSVNKMLLSQGPPHFSIRTFFSKFCTCFIIILDLYGLHCGFLQQNGFAFPVLTENLYPRIVRFSTSLYKNPDISLLPRSTVPLSLV